MERTSDEIPVLVAQAGPLNGGRWYIQADLTIGRDPTCTVVIPDRQISRHHARLSLVHDGVLLEDLHSKNGTHCNGEQIATPVLLEDGDTIQIALAQQFVYISSDATLPLDGDIPELGLHAPIKMGRLRLESKAHRVWLADIEVTPPLSASQYKLLEVLYLNQNRVVSRRKLIEQVWGVEQAVLVSEQALDALVRRLRERLAGIDPHHQYVVTVRGHGLRLDNPLTIE